jgi:hypothetical protein
MAQAGVLPKGAVAQAGAAVDGNGPGRSCLYAFALDAGWLAWVLSARLTAISYPAILRSRSVRGHLPFGVCTLTTRSAVSIFCSLEGCVIVEGTPSVVFFI